MSSVYKDILDSKAKNEKLLAVLIDPDKFSLGNTSSFIEKVNQSIATHIFIGGSIVSEGETDELVSKIKKHTNLPIVLFPGDISQITNKADALLFLSLISGRNPDYLIGKHVEAVSKLKSTRLEIISTGYILIESGKEINEASLKEAREHFEKEYLTNQLKKHHGNISKTADFIGMERSALHRKLKSLGIKGTN